MSPILYRIPMGQAFKAISFVNQSLLSYIQHESVFVNKNPCKTIFIISDIDECAQKGGFNGNHCHLNTICVNTNGSYECDCLPGFRRVDKFNCAELDECTTGQHACHENAECINTMGSYHCRCKDGYEGDGFDCKRKYRSLVSNLCENCNIINF